MGKIVTKQQRQEIRRLILRGCSRRETASRVGVSVGTVQTEARAMASEAGPPSAPVPAPSAAAATAPRAPASSSSGLGELPTVEELAREIADDLRHERSSRDAARAAVPPDDVAAQRASRNIVALSTLLGRMTRGTDDIARPMPSDEELDEMRRKCRARLWGYVERAAEGKS